MTIRIIPGILIILFACIGKQAEQSDSEKNGSSVQAFEKDSTSRKDDCNVWLADSDTTLSAGEFIKYIKENGRIKIKWGNSDFHRTLRNEYDCDGAPAWVPTIRWSTSSYIGLKYGCGSPCWGLIILPLNNKDSVIERMYDMEVDTLRNRIVYPDNETYDKLIVENFKTGQKMDIRYKFDCKAAFVGYCIDSMKLSSDMLVIKWVDWSKDGKEKKLVTEEFKLQF